MITENALITGAEIFMERGILTAYVYLEYECGGQGFGGYHLGGKYCADFVESVLRIVGVEKWSRLKGKTIRVKRKEEWDVIHSIGHIIKDDWFCPREEWKDQP